MPQSIAKVNQSEDTAMTRTKEPVPKRTIRKTENHEILLLTATLNLNKIHRLLNIPLHFKNYEIGGLFYTGAVKSALSENELRRIRTANPEALLHELAPPTIKIQIANGKLSRSESKLVRI